MEGKIKKILLCYFLATVLFGMACQKKTEVTAITEVIEGIEYVHNTATPLFPEKRIVLEEELSVREEDQDGNIILYKPGWYVVDDKEEIHIADLQDLQIKVFNPEGDLVRTIGRKGRGPGEFQNIGRLALLPDSRILVLDWEENRVSLFDGDGRFVDSHKMLIPSFDVYFCTDSFYIREETTHEPDGTGWGFKRKIFIKAFDYDGEEVFAYGEFQASQSAFVQGRFSFSKPYEVHSVLAGDQKNKRLYHCLSDKYLIEIYDQEGCLFRKIDRPYHRFPVTEKDKRRYLDGFRDRGTSEEDVTLIEKNAEMPEVKPVTDRMVVDDHGNLWIELNEIKEEDGRIFTAYDIFNLNGIYEAKVWLDISLGLIRGGKMYTSETDEETGHKFYKRYRMIWSEK